MLDHVSIPVADLARSAGFYDAVLAEIAYARRKGRRLATGHRPGPRRCSGFTPRVVGIDDIGETLGMTGPSIYRYFPGKAAILVGLHERTTEPLLAVAHDAENDPGATPASILRRLIRNHIESVIANRELYSLYLHERCNLPADDAKRIRTRLRTYGLSWQRAISAIHPQLDEQEVIALEGAVIGVIHSPVYFPARLEGDALCDLLERLAWNVLTLGSETPGQSAKSGAAPHLPNPTERTT